VPNGTAFGRVFGLAPSIRNRSRRARRDGHHGRMAGIPRVGQARLCSRHAQSAHGLGPSRGSEQAAAAVHRVASLAKRWLLGTHQGYVDTAHLPSYLNEFVFRFNRRHSRSRGMVFYRVLAVGHDPVRYKDIVAGDRPRKTSPTPPLSRGKPLSLDRPVANRPWRG